MSFSFRNSLRHPIPADLSAVPMTVDWPCPLRFSAAFSPSVGGRIGEKGPTPSLTVGHDLACSSIWRSPPRRPFQSGRPQCRARAVGPRQRNPNDRIPASTHGMRTSDIRGESDPKGRHLLAACESVGGYEPPLPSRRVRIALSPSRFPERPPLPLLYSPSSPVAGRPHFGCHSPVLTVGILRVAARFLIPERL
jgi:hypothetical protein